MKRKNQKKMNYTLSQRGPLAALRKHWQLYLLVLLPIVAVFIFHYIPLMGVQIAFRKYSPRAGIWKSTWVGLKYIKQFLNYPKCWQIIWNTLRLNLLVLVFFPLPIILAIMFNDLKDGRFKRGSQILSYAPHFVSTVVVCSMTLMFLNRETGVINLIIQAFGGEAQDWMGNSKAFAPVYALTELWQNLGWDTIIYTACLSSVSVELIDAAKVDGATRLQIVRNVYLPHLLPTVMVLLLLKIGSMVNVGFEKILLLQNPLNTDVSTVLSTYIYNVGILDGQSSYATAVELFQSLVNIALVVFFNFVSRKTTKQSLW